MAKSKESVTRQIIGNSIWNFTASIITRLGALIFAILLARFLMPEGYGIYSLALSIALITMTLSNLGLNDAFTRYVSYAIAKNNKKLANSYYRYLLKIKFSLIIFASIGLMILAYPLSTYVFSKPSLFLPLFLFGFYIFFISMEGFFGSFFIILKKIKYTVYRDFITQTIRILLVISLFLTLSPEYFVPGVVVILTITGGIVLFYTFYMSRRLIPFIFKRYEKQTINKKRVWKFLISLSFLSLTGIFFSYIDSLMLGIFIPGAEFLGFYRAAYTFVFSISGVLSIAAILLPYFTQFKKNQLKNAFFKVFRYTSMITIPASIGVLILGKYFIVAIYGRDYLLAALPLSFLALLIFSETITGLYNSLFTAKEKPQYLVKALIISSILNVVLNVVLILTLIRISPIWAVAGAAIATLISRYFYLVYMIITTNKKLKLKTNFSPLYRQLFAGIVMAVFLVLFINNIDVNLVFGVIGVLIGIVSYFVTLFIVGGLTKEDVVVVKQFWNYKYIKKIRSKK